jgi:hypothetical protein
LKSAWAKYFRDTVWKKNITERDDGVDQGVGPEDKTQNSKKNEENLL